MKIYKKISALVVLSTTAALSVSASSDVADYLAEKGIIKKQETSSNYRLEDNITRWEVAKVVTKLMKKVPAPTCNGYFADLTSANWQCKYSELLVDAGVVKRNSDFRPNDNITKIEVLKMIFKSLDYDKVVSTGDWKKDYVESAVKLEIMDEKFTDYDATPDRKFVFGLTKKFYDFKYVVKKEEEKKVEMPTKKMSN